MLSYSYSPSFHSSPLSSPQSHYLPKPQHHHHLHQENQRPLLVAMAAALLLLLLLISLVPSPSSADDAAELLLLKKSLSDPPSLSSWAPPSSPCDARSPWAGVICFEGIVTGLRLESLSLSGDIDVNALERLPVLRSLSFANNSFSGPIPPLDRLEALKALYLNDNRFSGPIPSNFFDPLRHLKKLHLANNAFSGPIPPSLSAIPTLIELRLEGNRFAGPIPSALSRFDAKSFSGNQELCGPPLADRPCVVVVDHPHAAGAASGSEGKTAVAVVVIILCALMIVAAASTRRRGRVAAVETLGVDNGRVEEGKKEEGEKTAAEAAKAAAEPVKANNAGELVMVGGEKGAGAGFGLGDLMKAAAEMLGNGGMGSAYKAVMVSGLAVAVKRMRDMNRVGKDTFDLELRRLGRLRHKNVLPPLAYYYRKEEKLLIYDFIPNGSLQFALHGNKGPEQKALDWPTRLKIILGVVRGMVYLHGELTSVNIPHGNLKSCNVLLAADFEPLLVDYGYVPLVNPSCASQAMFAYKSPESLTHRHVCPKSDVYCLGILLLEILTGKFPSQYLNNAKGGTDVVEWAKNAINDNRVNELLDPVIVPDNKSGVPEMERLVRVAAACVEPDLDQRLSIKAACEQIEEIAKDVARTDTSAATHTKYVKS